jgi:cytochrome c2
MFRNCLGVDLRRDFTIAALLCSMVVLCGAANDTPADTAQGKAVYAQRCEICHYSDSTAKKMGPGLKDIYGRGKFANGKKVDDASVTAWI